MAFAGHPGAADGRVGRRRLTLWLGGTLGRLRHLQAQGRMRASVRQAELDGLRFAIQARFAAVLVVAVLLVFTTAYPRNVYYVACAALFFALGYIPYRLRHHRHGEWIKLGFVLLDVILVTAVVLIPPPAGLSMDWPIQTRLRGPEFLYLVLLLAEAALTYSPLTVLWTGSAIMTVWSIGAQMIYARPDTTRVAYKAVQGSLSSEDALRLVFEPTFVGLAQLTTQLVAAGLFTLIIAVAVWRSRLTLLARVESEVIRADLARYVSPDVADALSTKASFGFGEPVTRDVAVLFADVVGFTGMSETLSPERTFALLRSFHDRSCRIVFEHGGTLDKYLGDGFMATFGGVVDQPDAAARALACAFALQKEMGRWNAKRQRRDAAPIALAVGIHCGSVVVGNLGVERRIEFTVVGDVVNVASRLQQATREVGAAIVASNDCVHAAGAMNWSAFFDRTMDMELRGRRQPIAIHIAGPAGA